jgi:hypothetical protein
MEVRKLIAIIVASLLLGISCAQDPHYPLTFVSTDLTYSVSGPDHAYIKYKDSAGTIQTVTNAALPQSITITGYANTDPWIWAQNANTSDYINSLVVKITSQQPGSSTINTIASTSSVGFYCISTISGVLNWGD